MNKPVDKDSLQLNQPKRTPGHPTKSHIVKTKADGKEKIIRFGQQGASTAGKPKEGESDRMTAKRASFKARHSANIAKGPSSAAYWANKVKWADGGSVRTNYADGDSVQATPQQPVLGSIANFLKKSYSPERTQQAQGIAEFFDIPALARTVERMSYGEPITNVGKANVPMLPDDTAAAAMLVGPTAGPLGRFAKKTAKAGAKVVGEELNRAILDNSGALAKFVPEAAKPMYVIKPEGGNWLSGSVEDSLNLMRHFHVPSEESRLIPDSAINKWIDTKLNKYIKNDMATPEDPVRALAERGILHVNPAELNYRLEAYGKYAKPDQRFLAKSDAAKMWEGASDNALSSSPAGNWLKFSGDTSYAKGLEENPWLRQVPPETPVYQMDREGLGFGHLIDELRNAVDPNSTLPANLRLKYDDLDKVTMPQAVERVSKINDWRAAEAAKAELAGMTDNLMAVPRLQDPTAQLSFVKEPGMTWVDIPATTDKNAKKLCTTIGRQAGWCTQGDSLAETYGSGNNRLTTMLDAEGRPHVQAKISSIPQSGDIMEDIDDLLGSMSAAEQRKFNKFLGSDDFYGEQEEALEWLQTNMPKAYDRYIASVSGPPSIGEIKPVGNDFGSARAQEYGKRDPKYKVKITDSVLKFLNSGEWGIVQEHDLDHFGIVDLRNPSKIKETLKGVLNYESPKNRVKKFNEALELNPEAPRFMSFNEFKKFVGSRWAGLFEGFAAGGSVSVYDPDKIDEIINGIDEPTGYAEGGEVRTPDMDFKEDPETLRLYKHAMKQFMPNQEDTISTVSTGVQGRVGGGNLSAGIDMNRMTKGQQDQLMKSIAASYNVDLGGLNLNARLEAPLDAKDVYVGMINGSIPIAEGRAMLGVQGIKTPYGSDVLGYNAGYSGKVGPGRLNVNVNKPKRGKPSAQVQYQIPFAQGGPVHMGKGGNVEDTLDTFVAPRYRKQRATPSSKETKAKVAEAAQFAADMVIPQSAFDVALTLLPFGKPGKALAAGILAGSPAEAQAGNMSALLKLVAKEAPEQFQSIRNALLRTYHSGLEHSVVGSTRMGGPSEVIQGTTSSAIPNKLDLKAARRNIDKSPLIDFHTHPSQTASSSEFKVRPSDTDLKYWMGQYGSSYAPEIPNEVRLMVGTPANKGERTTGAYNFFATDKPAQTLNPKTYEAAKYELQRSKPLQSIKDNSLVGMYLDSGGDLGDLLDSASPLLLQKYFAQKGLGRHEMQLSNRPVTSPSVTEQELFNQIANPAIEIIKSKRFESFAQGGSVSVYDPDQVDAIANQYM